MTNFIKNMIGMFKDPSCRTAFSIVYAMICIFYLFVFRCHAVWIYIAYFIIGILVSTSVYSDAKH